MILRCSSCKTFFEYDHLAEEVGVIPMWCPDCRTDLKVSPVVPIRGKS